MCSLGVMWHRHLKLGACDNHARGLPCLQRVLGMPALHCCHVTVHYCWPTLGAGIAHNHLPAVMPIWSCCAQVSEPWFHMWLLTNVQA